MKNSKTKLFIAITGVLVIGFGFFFTSKWWGGDDSIIRNTWKTGYFYDSSYRVNLDQVTYDTSSYELFFIVNQSKVDTSKTLKLQVDVIGKDDYLYPVQTFSHLENETMIDSELRQTIYSFSMPIKEWRYIRFMIQTEAADGKLSNQTVLYADYRSIETSETPLTLMDFLVSETQEELTESSESNPSASTDSPESKPNESMGEESQPSSQEETLQQQYTIEREPIILDGGHQEDSHDHDRVEIEEPIYTLEDLQHQEQKLNEEINQVQTQLTEQADNQDLHYQLADLQSKLVDVQQKIQTMKGE